MNKINSGMDDVLEKINKEIINAPNDIISCADEIISEIYQKKIHHVKDVDFSNPFKKIKKIILDKIHDKGIEKRNLICKLVLFKIALNLQRLIKIKKFPEGVIKLYPMYLERMLSELSNFQNNDLTGYSFALQIAMGVTVPCGAQIVDLRSQIPVKSIVKTLVLHSNFEAMKRYLKIRGWGRWYRIHTDSNYLTEFNEKGWNSCYLRISKMFENDYEARGMVGTSWFYDPQLLNISKHLSYLQRTPLSNGAFLVKHGTYEVDSERALRTSRTRRKFYKEGRYIPVCYSLIWPRDKMLTWSKSLNHK